MKHFSEFFFLQIYEFTGLSLSVITNFFNLFFVCVNDPYNKRAPVNLIKDLISISHVCLHIIYNDHIWSFLFYFEFQCYGFHIPADKNM